MRRATKITQEKIRNPFPPFSGQPDLPREEDGKGRMTTESNQANDFQAALNAARAQVVSQECTLVSTEELAAIARYAGVTDAFRQWLKKIGLEHLPGRPGIFDLKHFRFCLDRLQGLEPTQGSAAEAISLTEQRRLRRE